MFRQPSHSSSISNSTGPNRRLGIFRKWPSTSSAPSREEHGSPDKTLEPQHSDKIPASPVFSDLELSRSNNGLSSPDSLTTSTHDPEYLRLRDNIKRIRKAPAGPDPKKVDAAWEVYKKFREDSPSLCKSLLQKSQNHRRNDSLEYNVGPLDTHSSYLNAPGKTAFASEINDQWLSAIKEYKLIQETILDNLRTSLLSTYREHEALTPERQLQKYLTDKSLANSLVDKWRDQSVHGIKSKDPMFWPHLKIRWSNHDKLKLDIKEIERLILEAEGREVPSMAIREEVIAKDGDTILEFANAASDTYPILRFRVSSQVLANVSPLFSHFLSPQKSGSSLSRGMASQIPPPPSRWVCKDGMEVKVYQMPQVEFNNNEALTILLHAAHMHNPPREIGFPVFVSIAEVCLRYQCTSPLELRVECQWLPQWHHLIGDEHADEFLIISYAFGLRSIFTCISKSVILNATNEEEIQGKTVWPQAVRDKIKATRAAKVAQITECCKMAIGEYFRKPSEATDRSSSVTSLQLSSQPRCPRKSHMCDATNLGWLMLFFNELRIFPSIMKDAVQDMPTAPNRSVKEMVNCLRLVPSAPQVHGGVCDYVAAFRSDISDIYNSVRGLTLHDVSGRHGWALSKNAVAPEDRVDNHPRGLVELEAPLWHTRDTNCEAALSNEDISFRILSHLDTMQDLNAAIMSKKTFYHIYKRNEGPLLRNVLKAERRRTLSQAGQDNAGIRQAFRPDTNMPDRLNISIPCHEEEPKSLIADGLRFPPAAASEASFNELYEASTPGSRTEEEYIEVAHITDEVPMSEEEALKILYGTADIDSQIISPPVRANEQGSEKNEKCLLGAVAQIEDKAKMLLEDDKHLRDEKDLAMGLGIQKK